MECYFKNKGGIYSAALLTFTIESLLEKRGFRLRTDLKINMLLENKNEQFAAYVFASFNLQQMKLACVKTEAWKVLEGKRVVCDVDYYL